MFLKENQKVNWCIPFDIRGNVKRVFNRIIRRKARERGRIDKCAHSSGS